MMLKSDGWHRLAYGEFVQTQPPWFVAYELPFGANEAVLSTDFAASVISPDGGFIRLLVDGELLGMLQIARQSSVAQPIDISARWQEPKRDERVTHTLELQTEGILWLTAPKLHVKIPLSLAISLGLV